MQTKLISCVTYATSEQLKYVISSHSDQVQDCIAILHDKDTKEDGTPKESHLHFLISLKTSREISSVTGWLKKCIDEKGQAVNTLGEPVKSTKSAYEYLTHTGQDGKHQYADTDIIVLQGSIEHWLTLEGEVERNNRRKLEKQQRKDEQAKEVDQLIQDCIENVSERQMAQKYGRDYIRNRRTYKEFAAIVQYQETGEIAEHLVHDIVQDLRNSLNDHERQAIAQTAIAKTLTAVQVASRKFDVQCPMDKVNIDMLLHDTVEILNK